MRLTLVGAILCLAPGLLDPFIAAKHAVLMLGAAALAGAVLASNFMSPRRVIAPRSELEWLILAGLAVAAVSTVTSVSPMRSLLGEPEQREGLLTLVALGIITLASARAHPDTRSGGHTLDAFLLAAAATAAYALVQHAGFDFVDWVNPTLYPDRAGMVVRPGGTLGNALALGMVLAPALAVTLARLLGRPERWFTYGPLATLFASAILTTLSRGTWLAAAAGSLCAVNLAWSGYRLRPVSALRLLAIALGPAMLWAAIVLRGPILARLTEHREPGATSGPAREGIAQAALAIAREHPWLGSGPDTFGLLFPQVQTAEYVRDAWVGLPVHAHSAVLQLLATLGILGLLVTSGGGVALVRALRSSRHADSVTVASAAAIVALGVGACLEPLGLAGAAQLAVLAGLIARSPGSTDLALPRARPARVAVLGAAVALVACGFALLPLLRASASGGVARTLLELSSDPRSERAGGLEHGVAAAHAAMAADPWDDGYARLASDLELAVAHRLRQDRDIPAARTHANSALISAHQAVRLEPLRATAHQRVGSAHAMLAVSSSTDSAADVHSQRARMAFGRARALAPHDPLLLIAECRAALTLHDGHWALSSADALRSMSPRSGTAWALRAAALLLLGREPEGLDSLDSAAVARWEPGSERERAAVESGRRALGSTARAPR